jgi:phosphoenolpyruvate synthase/pyruvate phosphate dikinase
LSVWSAAQINARRVCQNLLLSAQSLACNGRAIFEAAADVQIKGAKTKIEVMIPLVGFPKDEAPD